MGGLMFPEGKKRKPAKRQPAEAVPFAFPKPSRRKPPMEAGQRRRSRIKQRRETTRRGPWRSPAYRARVRGLRCCAPGAPAGCRGRMTCSHLDQGLKEKGAGMKTGDQRTGPHCWGHNRDWDGHDGPFRGWTDEQRERYAEEESLKAQQALGWPAAWKEAA